MQLPPLVVSTFFNRWLFNSRRWALPARFKQQQLVLCPKAALRARPFLPRKNNRKTHIIERWMCLLLTCVLCLCACINCAWCTSAESELCTIGKKCNFFYGRGHVFLLTCKLTIHVSPHDTCNTVHTAQCFLRLERLVTRRWPSPSMISFKNMTYTLPYIMFIYKYHTRKCVWDWHSHSRRSPAHRKKSKFSEDTTSNRGKTHNRDTSWYL